MYHSVRKRMFEFVVYSLYDWNYVRRHMSLYLLLLVVFDIIYQ